MASLADNVIGFMARMALRTRHIAAFREMILVRIRFQTRRLFRNLLYGLMTFNAGLFRCSLLRFFLSMASGAGNIEGFMAIRRKWALFLSNCTPDPNYQKRKSRKNCLFIQGCIPFCMLRQTGHQQLTIGHSHNSSAGPNLSADFFAAG